MEKLRNRSDVRLISKKTVQNGHKKKLYVTKNI